MLDFIRNGHVLTLVAKVVFKLASAPASCASMQGVQLALPTPPCAREELGSCLQRWSACMPCSCSLLACSGRPDSRLDCTKACKKFGGKDVLCLLACCPVQHAYARICCRLAAAAHVCLVAGPEAAAASHKLSVTCLNMFKACNAATCVFFLPCPPSPTHCSDPTCATRCLPVETPFPCKTCGMHYRLDSNGRCQPCKDPACM